MSGGEVRGGDGIYGPEASLGTDPANTLDFQPQ